MASLIAKGRLRRAVQLDSGDVVAYEGNGMGWEGIFVNGEPVSIKRGTVWFVPLFEFEVAGKTARIEVSVGTTLKVRSFQLYLDGHMVYEDSHSKPPVPIAGATDWPSLRLPAGHATMKIGSFVVIVATVAFAAVSIRRCLGG